MPSDEEPSPWTVTSVGIEVYANPVCMNNMGDQSAEVRKACNEHEVIPAVGEQPTREYTIRKFEIAPYLPDDKSTALYKVLKTADNLYRKYGPDRNVTYKQHDWSQGSEEENLEKGIDCSRAIWYAFKNSEGVLYNHQSNAYLATADMVTSSTAMKDEFVRCDADELRTGDLLVYRDVKRRVGHVVMTIDPARRIAWGSHGWDGNIRLDGTSNTGVEYQLIKFKSDWEKWDRPDMKRVACWRHKQFAADWDSGKTRSTLMAIAEAACKQPEKCGVRLQGAMSRRPRPAGDILSIPRP
jgi:hypothetical protein